MLDPRVRQAPAHRETRRAGPHHHALSVHTTSIQAAAPPRERYLRFHPIHPPRVARRDVVKVEGSGTTRSRRGWAGLRQFLCDGGFGAFTTNFQDLGGLRQLPGLAVQRLMADGYGFGGEGDWKTSTMLAALKAMRPGGTSFMEDYTYHWGPGTPVILGSHMLEVCPTIAASRPSCEIHALAIGDREDPVRLVFDATPGPGIVLGITDIGDRFRFILNEIEVVAPHEPLPNLPVARAVWRPAPSLSTSAECWLTGGGPHHTVLSQAVDTETIDDFAAMLHTELLVIDGNTTPRSFADNVRWNAPYFRLAGGLPSVSR
jgi:L-arabinose isomerase